MRLIGCEDTLDSKPQFSSSQNRALEVQAPPGCSLSPRGCVMFEMKKKIPAAMELSQLTDCDGDLPSGDASGMLSCRKDLWRGGPGHCTQHHRHPPGQVAFLVGSWLLWAGSAFKPFKPLACCCSDQERLMVH